MADLGRAVRRDRRPGSGGVAVTIAVFAVGVAVWCLLGSWLVSHHRIAGFIENRGQWLIPAVYLLVAAYIFWKTGAFSRLQ